MKQGKKYGISLLLLAMMMAAMTGCGNNNTGNAADETKMNTQTKNSSSNMTEDTTDDAANDIGDAVDDVGDAVGDVADGVGDAIEELGDDFDYEDGHDYLLGRLGKEKSGRKYEVRNKSASLEEYQDGKQGYHYEVYDVTDGDGSKYGDYYIDQDDGTVYRRNPDTNRIEEY